MLLDLQAVFDSTYDRTGYDYSLKYSVPVGPELPQPQREWIAAQFATFSTTDR